MDPAPPACPQCAGLLPPAAPRCPNCGLRLVGPDAAQLWMVDQSLIANERQRAALLSRRHTLLALLRQAAPVAAAPASGVPVGRARSTEPEVPRPREASSRSVQNVLLSVGGLLLAVAAVVFTVVAWGRFGLAGRAAILLTFTGVALALPGLLVKRRLPATAETISLLGLLLIGMDGYAAHAGGLFGWDRINGFGFAAAVCAVIAATAAGYPLAVPVRLIRPVGVVVGQLPIPLLAVAMHATPAGVALAASCVATADVLLLALTEARAARWSAERWLAGCLAGVAGLVAVPLAGALTFFQDHPGRPAIVMALCGLVALGAALLVRAAGRRDVLAGFGLVLLAAAAIGIALPALGGAGALAPAVAAALLAGATLSLPPGRRRAVLGAGSVLLAAGSLAVLRPVILVAVGPFRWLAEPWTGRSMLARTSVDPHLAWSSSPWALGSVVLLGAAATVTARQWWGRTVALPVAAAGLLATVLGRTGRSRSEPHRRAARAGPGSGDGMPNCGPRRSPPGLRGGRRRRPGAVCRHPGCRNGPAPQHHRGAAGGDGRACGRGSCGETAGGRRGGMRPADPGGGLGRRGSGARQRRDRECGRLDLDCRRRAGSRRRLPSVRSTPAACPRPRGRADRDVRYRRPDCPAPRVTPGHGARRGRAAGRGVRHPAAAGGRARVAGGNQCAAHAGGPDDRVVAAGAGLPRSLRAAGWGPAPGTARAAVGPGQVWAGDALVPAVLALVAVGGAAAVLALLGRTAAIRCAVPAGAISAGVLPLALNLPWPVTLAVLGAIATGLLATAAATRAGAVLPPAVPGTTAAAIAGTVLAWSLAAAPATVIALTAAAGASLLAAVFGRSRGLILAATVAAGALAVADGTAGALASGLPLRLAAFATLAVAAGLAGISAMLRRHWTEESICCELVAAAAGLVGIAQSAGSSLTLSVALSVAGLAVGASALRADRRPAALVGAALLVLSSWVRLADLGVTAPEAYSVPVAAITLFLGALRRRQRPGLSSWLAYGPGLAAGLLPSLAALVAARANAVRPLGLGTAALVVLLAGGRQRLQAPLLLGAGVLVTVAGHELAPAVTAAITALPRWVPLATAGLLLVLLGSTYEHRRRDLRRLRDALTRLS